MVNKIKLEGAVSKGKKVVVVEDLISTGGSSITAVEALKDAGADVLECRCYFYLWFKESR